MNLNLFRTSQSAKRAARHLFLLFTGSLMVFTACQDGLVTAPSSSENDLSIQFKTASQTRFANDLMFDVGDSIGIYSVQWADDVTPGQLRASGNRQDNIPYWLVGENDNWATNGKGIIYPFGGEYIDLYAYYPYMQAPMNSDARIGLSVIPDQTSLANYKHSDFKAAVARKLNRYSGVFHFEFYHRLSQVRFELIAGDGVLIEDLLAARIKLKNIITEGEYSYTGGNPDSVHVGTTVADITPCGAFTIEDDKLVGKAAIIMPQILDNGNLLEITVGGTVVTADFSDPVTCRSGESRLISITLNGDGIEFTTEIKPWDEQPPTEEKPIMATFEADCESENDIRLEMALSKDVEINWGDGTENTLVAAGEQVVRHTYDTSKGNRFKTTIYGDKDAISIFISAYIITGVIDFSGCNNLMACMIQRRTNQDVDFDLANCPLLEFITFENLSGDTGKLKLDIAQSANLKEMTVLNTDSLMVSDLKNNLSLVGLDFSNVTLNSIDLTEHVALGRLKLILKGYESNTIDLTQNVNLTALRLDYMEMITEVDLSANTLLEGLFIMHMPVSVINLSPFGNLKEFHCNNTNVASLNFSSNPLIEYVNCTECPISGQDLIDMAISLPTREGMTKGRFVIEYEKKEYIFRSIIFRGNWEWTYY